VRVHSLTLSCTPESTRCDSWASLLALTLASPCLGREPKARVAITLLNVHDQKVEKMPNPTLGKCSKNT